MASNFVHRQKSSCYNPGKVPKDKKMAKSSKDFKEVEKFEKGRMRSNETNI